MAKMWVSMSEVEDDKTDTAKEETKKRRNVTDKRRMSLSVYKQGKRKGVERTLLAGIIKIYAHIKR